MATFQRLIESSPRQHCEPLSAYINDVPASSKQEYSHKEGIQELNMFRLVKGT